MIWAPVCQARATRPSPDREAEVKMRKARMLSKYQQLSLPVGVIESRMSREEPSPPTAEDRLRPRPDLDHGQHTRTKTD